MAEKKVGFEASMAELEDILAKMSDDGTTLEESIKLYARAAKLIEECDKGLRGAEVKVREIDEKISAITQRDMNEL